MAIDGDAPILCIPPPRVRMAGVDLLYRGSSALFIDCYWTSPIKYIGSGPSGPGRDHYVRRRKKLASHRAMRHYGTHQIQTASYRKRRHNSCSGNVDDILLGRRYVMFAGGWSRR
ncbi:hypothetical protein Zmor_013072 [Zophobas morio]|uniref:Uncharacterized protein n=1 Tax=Zophobas morio TaxID=2755281 RepID=A0AA38MEA4_9CUCU|nr:hypothetical protein Zmor_013072 [Zophobas morio]